MEWESYETVYAKIHWENMYKEAEKYAKKHGGIHDMPTSYVTEDGKELGSWIGQMRGIRKGSRKHSIVTDEERIIRLDNIGMDWNPSPFVHKKRNKPNIKQKNI